MTQPTVVHLRAGGTSLLLDCSGDLLPRVVHWGGDLGGADPAEVLLAQVPPVPNSSYEEPVRVGLLPDRASGFAGRPGLTGSRDGLDWSPQFRVSDVRVSDVRGTEATVTVEAVAAPEQLRLRSELTLAPSGLLSLRHTLTSTGGAPYRLDDLTSCLPVPAQAQELLDTTGRWAAERHPQRRTLGVGAWVRENRHGRTGHDTAFLLAAGTPGFGFRRGEVWAVHLAWSGSSVGYGERTPAGPAALGAGELLEPGEVVLGPGESYTTPWLHAAYSADGLDGVSAAFHGFLRARPEHPTSPRKVVLNTWEAVYFDHRLDRLTELADTAAALGVERFVLDDGWFRGRRDDRAGLGDWFVDETVWPQGLTPLAEHVTGLGMELGLWVEPEMVNPDSDLAREHPEWLFVPRGRPPLRWRHQLVLDLVHPDAYTYVLGRLDAVLSENAVSFLKWDHNRDLVDAAHDGRPAVHAQTLALYRLLDELRALHPGVEIESCASGGARVDLGILQRTDRVWASDTNDALERQVIQRWTGVLVPPELVGAHVGPPRSHTTGRVHGLSFRVATALFGHFGLEWDVTPGSATDADRAALASAVAFYKEHRRLLHTGTVVRVDHPDPAVLVHGVVAADGSAALFACVQLTGSRAEVPGAVRLAGLAPDRLYRVRAEHPAGEPEYRNVRPPAWLAQGEVVLSGQALATVGLQLPVLQPEQALLLTARAV
jgi:alpha-galactosidase